MTSMTLLAKLTELQETLKHAHVVLHEETMRVLQDVGPDTAMALGRAIGTMDAAYSLIGREIESRRPANVQAIALRTGPVPVPVRTPDVPAQTTGNGINEKHYF